MRASAILVAILSCATARAFPSGDRFDATLASPDGLDTMIPSTGSGGVYFTGSPRFQTATCSTCHVNPPRLAGARLLASPADLFTVGYQPGMTYTVELDLTNETKGLDKNTGDGKCGTIKGTRVPCNPNGFVLEVDDVFGQPAGTLASGNNTLLLGGGAAIAFSGTIHPDNGPPYIPNGETAWRFQWTAPSVGTGPVTFNGSLVDGDGGQGTDDVPNDNVNDDVAEVHVSIAEAGAPAPPVAGGGCHAAPGLQTAGALSPGALVALSLLLLWLARRRSRT